MTLAIKKLFVKKHDVDMTEGSIVKNILFFAFPLMLGNLFQQQYNMVDTWGIGKTGVNGAFAAVGSIGPITNILIGFFMGLSSGAGVVISQYYGAKNYRKVKEAVHTAVAMTLVLGVLFTIVGLIMTPTLLKLMLHGKDGEVYPYALQYLTIYFSGLMGLMLYNVLAGIMRAVGDSSRPFMFLLVSSIVNMVLDFVFVFSFGMSVAGVALATIIAQWVSAILAIITLLRTDSCIKITVKDIKLQLDMLKKIVLVGIPAGIQLALTAFSNVFVQSYISNVNMDTTIALSGWTAYSKLDMFIFLPVQSIGLAVTTFVGQNIGIDDEKRARKGTYTACGLSAVITACMITVVFMLSPFLVGIFNKDPEVIKCGTMLLRYLTPFYMFICVNQIFAAALRGAGKQGVLIKGANYLEMLSMVNCVVFDKTGALTEGVFEVAGVYPENISKNELMEYASLAESYSNHPISESLIKSYAKVLDKSRGSCFTEMSGFGVSAKVYEKLVLVGNSKLMKNNNVSFTDNKECGTVVYVAIDGVYAGSIVISDKIKTDSAEAIKKLRSIGIKKTVMLTGDRREIAERVSASIGVDECHAQLLPADKVSLVERMIKNKNVKDKIAFVGDCINDAPVLARSDVGVAMGALGSDAAIEAADIVLMDDKPSKLYTAIKISKKCMSIVYQNIYFSIGIKLLVLALGLFGVANMWFAIFADVGVMILAVLNSIRAMKV